MASKIDCTGCGVTKAVRPEVYEKRVSESGSEKKLLNSYLCRECRPKKSDEKAAKKTAKKSAKGKSKGKKSTKGKKSKGRK